jgi:hypothetical protein
VVEKEKTYKRETALGMLVFLACLMIYGIYNEQAFEVGKHLSAPIFLFAAGAFAIDAYSKQVIP